MAPQITDDYTKNLNNEVDGINYNDLITELFIMDKQSNFFKFKLYSCNLTYHLVAEIYEISFGSSQDFILEYIEEYLTGFNEEEKIAKILELGMHAVIENKVIGRFVFIFKDYNSPQRLEKAVQVKGAFISNEFAGAKLACRVYEAMKSIYGCVMSDNRQSVAGAKLWASSLVGKQDLVIYDIVEMKSVGVFTDGDIEITSKIWSIPLKYEESKLSVLEDFLTINSDDRTNRVLLYK